MSVVLNPTSLRNLSPSALSRATELLRELRATRAAHRFTDFAKLVYPRYDDAAHLRILADKLEAVERGDISRLIVTMPPRHGKTWTTSHLFPSWFLGRNPERYVIAATYAQDFADDIGRAVRNIIAGEEFGEVFTDCKLADDNASIRRFATNHGGSYFAVGAGGPITGRGADLLLIDDPIKGREDADSETMRRQLRDWYTAVAYTRLMPGGRVVLIQCLAGDTAIAMKGGRSKRLDSIRPGERVLSWNGRRFVSNKVSAVIDNGPDQTYLIKTMGSVVRANARHPFLVLSQGGLEWVRTKDLRAGMRIVALRRALTQVPRVRSTGAISAPNAAACAPLTTTKQSGPLEQSRHLSCLTEGWQSGGNGDTGSAQTTLTDFSPSRAGFARSAEQTEALAGRVIGSQILSRITITTPGGCEACFATTVTGLQDELAIPAFWNEPSNTSGIDTDEVVSVDLGGVERVYDLTVEGGHNFVADGLVSHNTRWREDDLAGWLLKEHAHEEWKTVDFPAILPNGEPLWPERFGLDALKRIERTLPSRDWNALYMQRPTVEEGGILKRQWWQRWTRSEPPPVEHIVLSLDTAFSEKDSADFSAATVWGYFRSKDTEDETKAPKVYDNIMLLDAWQGRVDFPDLRAQCKALIKKHDPDTVLIEKKASGQSLIQELRRQGIPVVAYTPDRDKVARAYSVQSIFESDCVWAPQGKSYADMVIDQCAAFPTGAHDDLVDCTVQALIRFRQSGRLSLDTDPFDEPTPKEPRKRDFSYYA